MKLTVLGSGSFFVTEQQTASAFLLEVAGKKILIDCGPGTLYRLSQHKIKPEDLDYIFLTHFHPDHSSDLFSLFMNFRLGDIFAPDTITHYPHVFGPPGIRRFLVDYSRSAQLPSFEGYGPYLKVEFSDYSNNDIDLGNFHCCPIPVDHNAFNVAALAYALRFTADSKTLVFSGDCSMCPGIRTACQGCDLFICDASYPAGKTGPAHLDTTDIGHICQEEKVKKVLLTHFYPQFANSDLVVEVKKNFSGAVDRCQDGMVIEI